MLLPILAAASLLSYAATPERAALQAVGYPTIKPAIVRVNVAGPYATVLTSGGIMEGSPITSPILVQHFSFGWQPLEVLNFRCRLQSHHLGARREAILMRGTPSLQDVPACSQQPSDAGPASDVGAVRRLMHGPLVPYVIVSRDWALSGWYGAGGGNALFQRRAGRWHLVKSGGGAMDFSYVRALGVPYEDACKLQIYDAKCR